jgi:Polyketide cyclase / dehydrase and lipid transport
MITSKRTIAAPTHLVHALLTDVGTWALWSPHISRVDPPSGSVAMGWEGRVKAWFSPLATTMTVTWSEPGRGMGWTSRGLGHRLDYEQRIEPVRGGSVVTFTAQVVGRYGELLTRLALPLSALGQRRRLRRLGALAEWEAHR